MCHAVFEDHVNAWKEDRISKNDLFQYLVNEAKIIFPIENSLAFERNESSILDTVKKICELNYPHQLKQRILKDTYFIISGDFGVNIVRHRCELIKKKMQELNYL